MEYDHPLVKQLFDVTVVTKHLRQVGDLRRVPGLKGGVMIQLVICRVCGGAGRVDQDAHCKRCDGTGNEVLLRTNDNEGQTRCNILSTRELRAALMRAIMVSGEATEAEVEAGLWIRELTEQLAATGKEIDRLATRSYELTIDLGQERIAVGRLTAELAATYSSAKSTMHTAVTYSEYTPPGPLIGERYAVIPREYWEEIVRKLEKP